MGNDSNDKDLVPVNKSIRQTQRIEMLDNEFSQKQTWLNNLNFQVNMTFSQLMFLQDKVNWSNQESIRIQQEAIDKYGEIIKKGETYAQEIRSSYEKSMQKINSLKDEIRDLEIKKAKLEMETNIEKNKNLLFA